MNKIAELCGQAFDLFWNNKLRSLLTMLGLIIGVGSVIAIMAVGDATNKSVQHLLSPYSLASSYIAPKPDQPDPETAQIRFEDARRVARMVPAAASVQPILSLPMETRVQHTDKTILVFTAGEGVGFDSTPLSDGRRFTQQDLSAHRRVCIISANTRDELFGAGAPALGRTIRLDGSSFTVVGVQAPPQSAGLLQTNAGSPTASIPYSLAPALGYRYVNALAVVASGPDVVTQTGDAAIAALKKIHGQRSQYQERDIKTLDEGIAKTFAVLTGVIGIVAGISLLVGGVGIMNIMLVSVTERTREIGLRKAIGAKRSDILAQFLIEALLLCCIGGIIGLAGGVGLAELVIHLLIVKLTGAIVSFAWLPIVSVAVIFSVGVGILFGTYPAVRASYLDPIEALRYE
ncbi:MAG: ABC transporter permease [Candidatus Eremiobacteraeota bacterium]|nr:ABC transporter permease [Candidatus Eremiobacteraeota bacterium]MBC5827790.1 ABC transporter permease [Candidatus Eremiobacteraeota bacterium]